MLGCSTREDVLELYGQPSDSFEAYVLTYETNDSFDLASWRLGFDDSGILDDVMVHHQSYFRSDYYRLEKDFEGGITLESTPEGFRPITGEAGRKEKKRDPLTVIIDKINEKYGTNFTEMDKVLLQMENDYAAQDRWHSYAKNNDRNTFMLLFEKDFPNMAAARYEQNEDFFVKLFSEPDMMQQVMKTMGPILYERLRNAT